MFGNTNSSWDRVPEKLKVNKGNPLPTPTTHPLYNSIPPLPTAVEHVFRYVGGKHAFMDVPLLNEKNIRKTSCQPASVPATRKEFSREGL